MKKLITIIAFVWLIISAANASHIRGGNIVYECIGPNQYLVTLTKYVDCATDIETNTNHAITVTNDCGFANPIVSLANIVYQQEVSQICAASLANSECNAGTIPGVYMHQWQGIVNLPGCCDSWTFSFSDCCLTGTSNLTGSPNIYWEAKLNSCVGACNSSPVLNTNEIPYVCVNQPVSWSPDISEPDGNTLQFTLTDALTSASTSATYGGGFSGVQPVPGASVDINSGLVTFTPTVTGIYVFYVLIEEYDAVGNLIGSVTHEMQFEVENCTNNIPTPASISNFSGTAAQAGPDEVSICTIGDNFCFDIVFTDPDAGDNLTLSSNVSSILPGATFMQTGTNPATGTVCWNSVAGFTGNLITVQAADDNCDRPGMSNYVVELNFAPALSVSGSTTICGNLTAPLSASGAGPFTWSVLSGDPINLGTNFSCNPCSNPTASPSVTTVYQVADACGNTDQVTVTVVDNLGTVTANIATPDTAICDGSCITLSGSGSSATFTWTPTTNMSNSNTLTPTVCPAASATYVLTIFDGNNCFETDTIDISITPQAAPTLLGTDETCDGANDGTITVTPNGGVGPYTYSLTGPSGPLANITGNFTALAPGNYTVTVTDDVGCSENNTITINAGATTSAGFTYNGNQCFTTQSFDFTDISTNATSWSWNFGASATPTTSTAQNPAGITFSAPGTYAVSLTATNGACNDIFTTNITVFTNPTVNASSTNVTCNGLSDGTLTAFASGTSGYSYNWDNGAGAGANITGQGPNTYTVTVTDVNGCQATNSTTITQPLVLSGSITSQTNATCNASANGTVTVAGAGGTTPYQYSINAGATYQASGTFGSLAAGVYSILIRDANGCQTTVPVTITEPAAITADFTYNGNQCFATQNFNFTDLSVNATAWSWDFGASAAPTTSSSQNPSGITFSAPGTYAITLTASDGVCSDLFTTNITVYTNPSVNASSTDVTCNGFSDGTLAALASGTSGYTYNWNNGAGAGANITGLGPNTYMVTVTDVNGCQATDVTTISEPTALSGSISSQTNIICNGNATGSVSILASGGSPAYSYSINGGATYQASNTFSGLIAGAYTITVRDSEGCTFNVPVTITQPTAVSVSTTSTTDATCGQSNGQIVVSASGGNGPYQFSIDGGTTFQASGTFNTLPSGNYLVTAQDANGCQNSINVIINDLNGITASITAQSNPTCNGFSDGSVTITASGSTAPYTYSINGGITFQLSGTFTSLAAGMYTVIARDANNCTFSVAVNILDPTALSGSILTQTDVSCTGNTDGQLTASASGGTPGYQYSINGGITYQGSGTFTGLAVGSHTITIRDANNCVTTVATNIGTQTPINLTIAGTDATCNGACNGSADATITGGTGPYLSNWAHGPTSQDLTGVLCAGTYTLDITDVNGCTAQQSVTINEPTAISTSISGTNVSCNGANNGTATVNAVGGTGALGYIWSPAPGAGQGTVTASGLNANVLYTVTVIDQNGCTATESFTPTQPSALTLNAVSTNSNCGQSDGTITANAGGGMLPYTYQWYSDAALTINIGSGAIINSLPAGTYYVQVTDGNGCTLSTTAVINDTPSGTLSQIHTDVSCNGGSDGSIDLTVTGGTGPFSYSWNGPAGFTSFAQDIVNLLPGNYTVSVTDNVGCVLNTAVTIQEPTAVSVTPGSIPAVCFGSSDGSVNASASGGTGVITFEWFTNPALTASIGFGSPFNGLPAGTYYVEATDANGCTDSDVITITQPADIIPVITSTDASCGQSDGTVSVVSISGGTGTYVSQNWTDGFGNPVANISAVPSGTYTVLVTDNNGCTGSAIIGVSDLTGPTISLTSQTDVTCNGGCDGTAVISASGGTGGYTFNWTPAPGSGQGTVSASAMCAGNYVATVTDANGCSDNVNITVNEPTALTATITSTTTVTINGLSDGSASVSGSGGTPGYTYEWFNNCPATTTTGITNANATGLSAGDYSAVVTDNSGCTDTVCVTITEPPVITLIVSGTNTLCSYSCDGTTNVVASGGVGGYTYQWYDDATGFPIPGQNSVTATNLCPGDYYVIVFDANGASATSSLVTIGNPSALTGVTAVISNYNGADVSCNGSCNGSVNVVPGGGTPGYLYLWDNPAASTTQTVNGLCAGTYNVTITDLNGCQGTFPVTVTQPTALTNTIASTNASCFGVCDATATANPSGGTGAYSYQWDDPFLSITQGLTNLCDGTYNVVVTDANNCTVNSQIIITEPTELILNSSSVGAHCGMSDGSASVAIVQGDAPFLYQWDVAAGSQTTPTAGNLSFGCYDVTVTDANGCSSTITVCVQDLGAPTVTPLTVTNVTCNGVCDGFAQVQVSGGNAPYNYQWFDSNGLPVTGISTTPSANNLCADQYTAQMTDVNGCVATVAINITEPLALNAAITASNDVTCFGDCDGSATVTISGGTLPYSRVWNDPANQTSATAVGLCPGNYTCTVTDINGCTTVDNVTINEPAEILLSTSVTDAFCNTASGTATVNITQGSVGAITYLWNPTGQGTATATNLFPGNYNVIVTDADGCQQFTTATVNNIPPGVASINTTTNVSCNGANDGTATVSMVGGSAPFSYQWFDGSGNPIAGQINQTASGLAPGQYYVVVTDIHTCQSTSNTIVITEPNALGVTFVVDSVDCFGGCDGSATANVTGGTGPYQYAWNNALMEITPTAQGLCAQNYTVNITDANGCFLSSNINIPQPTQLQLDSVVTNAHCGLSDGQACAIVTGGTGPYTYLWPDASTLACISNMPANTYLVQVTDGNNCTSVLPVTISDISGPTAAILNQVNATCTGNCDGSATVTMIGGAGVTYSVLWGPNTGNQTSPTASNLCAGNYTVTITDNIGCTASTSVTITEPTPLQYVTNVINNTCFNSCDGSAWVNVVGGTPPYSYVWLNNGGTPISVADSISGLCVGTYTVNITDAKGCTASTTATITQPIQVTGSVSSTNVSCFGFCDGTATAAGITGPTPFTYQWDDPSAQTTATAINLCAGTYSCVVTAANGCSATVSVTVTQPSQLSAAINTFGQISCNGACDGFAQVTVAGGTPGYAYSWNNGAGVGQTANNLCPNNYVVTVTDLNGCSVNAQINITQPTALAASTNSSNVSCNGACNGTASVSVSGGTGPYTYQWNDPSFSVTPSVTSLCAGTYSCTITDANGCQIVRNFNITEPNTMGLTANITNANCGQANGGICVNVIGGLAPYTYQWSDPNSTTSACLNNVVSGCYTITIIDANGCIFDSLLCINNIAGPTVSIVNSANVTCSGDMDGMVEFSVSGGTGISSIQLLDANGAPVSVGQLLTNNLSGGCYTLTATDQAGCVGTNTICITEPNALNAAVTSHTNVSCNQGSNGQATVSVSGGTPAYTYSWNAGATPNAAINTGMAAGNHTVIITDQNNCSTSATVQITQPGAIVLNTLNQQNPSCNGSCNGSVVVTTSGGVAPYVYAWNPNVSSGPVGASLCNGLYNVDVTDANGCLQSIAINIVEPAVLTGSSTVVNSTCSFCNGSATAIPNGGTAPYTYLWLNGGNNTTSQTNTGMCPGIHSVKITDAKGCITTIQVVVNDDSGPIVTGFNLNGPSCNGLNNGSAEILYTGGTAPVTFQWDAAAFNQVSNPAVALAGGTYCVTMNDANGCQVTQCVTLQEPAPLLPVPDIDATICFGDSSQVWASAVGGTSPYTINWTTPGMFGTGPITVSPPVTTDYCFNVTDANGCLSPVGCVTIQVVSPLSLLLTTTSGSICPGDTINVTATGRGANGVPYNLIWFDQNGFSVPSTQTGNQSVITVSPPSTAWYYVTLSDGCTIDAVDSSQVIVNPVPIPTLNAVQTVGCTPFTAQFVANSDIGVTYQFDFECDGVIDYSGPNPNPTYTYYTPGFHDVCMTVISADGCDTSVSYLNLIEVLPLPVAEFSPSPAITTSLNPTITFTDMSSSSAASVTYTWDFGDGFILTGNPNANIPDGTHGGLTIGTFGDPLHTYTDTGWYDVTLTVTTIDGCQSQVTHSVYIEGDYILFAPTAFSPDDDGLNEVFIPVGLGLVDDDFYKMFIYDRWGHIIYTSDNPDIGWNGTLNGNPAKSDVYVWMIQAKDRHGLKHHYVGHVTLVR